MRRVGYSDCAPYIGVPVGTLRSWVSRQRIPHIRLGPKHVLFDLDAVDAWLAEHVVEARPVTNAPALRVIGADK